MQKLISQMVPAQYFSSKGGDVALIVSTSAALMFGSMGLAGVTAQKNIVDVFTDRTRSVLVPPSTLPVSKRIMDPTTERWVRFKILARQWEEESAFRSSTTEVAMMPSYQKIIGMGEVAIPLILQQLRSEGNEPSQWFWALRAITGANPVSPEIQGNFKKMAAAWLEWGDAQDYAG